MTEQANTAEIQDMTDEAPVQDLHGADAEHAVRARRRLGLSDDPSEPEGVPPPPPPST